MRPLEQVHVINLHLEDLRSIGHKLDILQDLISNVVREGEAWLEVMDETPTFSQFNQYLSNESSRCLQTCLDIAGHSRFDEVRADISTMKLSQKTSEENFSVLSEKFEHLAQSLSKKIKYLERENRNQEQLIQELARKQTFTETENSLKFDDYQRELMAASDFIKVETEYLSEKVDKCEERNEAILGTQTFQNVEKKVSDLEEKILRFDSSTSTEAFCLQVKGMKKTDLKRDTTLQLFNHVVNLSLSPHFNKETGVYRVPHDGIYLVCLMVENLTSKRVQLHVYRKTKCGQETPLLFSQSYVKKCTSYSGVPVHMQKDDEMYIKSTEDYTGLKLGNNSFFWCVLIKKT
ncbi:uncharacterized protein LOC129927675 isoform X2 [Biomphalaria glabrata]|uniref:Uncharacterized protein LOC129927675 isoform X2 n=1 Tax=Biomphalaria glabrata TaxID=6526 RepID=A0A9W3B2Q1_BIOGL|nr:uncharacterized protein LOC129927675 isoform X2 [Biomphalaria glabrata]